ncbi:MAG TPA: efflux RND transporter periplasmic adaptor subunit [Vicinamibacterales bacterium]|jgi:cobalt-zinc-cadmium efflux system membrane fusion protein
MIRRFSLLLFLLLVAGCGPGAAPPAERTATPPAEAARRGAPRELRVAGDLQKKWGLVTGPVARLSVSGALTLPGVIALNQQRTAQISSVLEGKVTSIGADLGDRVQKNQVMLVLHSPAFAQAQTAFLQAAARRTVARRELDRARELLKDEAIQQKEFLRRQAEYEATVTEYGLAESQLHSFGWDHPQLDGLLQRAARVTGDLSDLVEPLLKIRAPIDGRVIVRDVVVGEHVHPDKLLFTVSELSTLWAVLDAREKDLPALVAGAHVSIATEVYPDRRFEGRVSRIGDVVDEKLRTIKVRVEVPNPGVLLKPNMFVQATLDGRRGTREVLGVPEDAIQTVEGEPTVFVVSPDRGFAMRPVALGDRVGAQRVIARGLDGTETIVITGAFNLKAELLKSSFAGE